MKLLHTNVVTVVNFATSKNPSRIQCSHIATFTSTLELLHMGRHSYSYHILIDKRWHSSKTDVKSSKVTDCDTDH